MISIVEETFFSESVFHLSFPYTKLKMTIKWISKRKLATVSIMKSRDDRYTVSICKLFYKVLKNVRFYKLATFYSATDYLNLKHL